MSELIKKLEGCKLTAYQDSAGVWTIGYGHTKGVKKGDVISQEKAEKLLQEDLQPVNNAIKRKVLRLLNQNQFAALQSFIFNVGVGGFEKSTLLKTINKGDYKNASKEFLKWIYITRNGVKTISKGLQNRRIKEVEMWEM